MSTNKVRVAFAGSWPIPHCTATADGGSSSGRATAPGNRRMTMLLKHEMVGLAEVVPTFPSGRPDQRSDLDLAERYPGLEVIDCRSRTFVMSCGKLLSSRLVLR